MSRRALGAAVLVVLLGGCAVPGWVPWLGKKRDEARPAPVMSRPAAGAQDAAAPTETLPKPPPSDENVTDRVVAVVNNDAITLGELQESVALYRQENRERPGPTDAELMRQFLGKLIDNRLQLQEAEREKIVIEDAELADELGERMKKVNARTQEEFEAMVRAQGLTMDAVRKRLRDSLRVGKVIRRKVTLRVTVTEAEIDKYLAANREKLEVGLPYHARHILITPESGSDAGWEAARIRADIIRAQLVEGADFAELARTQSRDASARDGGDLGTLKRGELAQDIEAQILRLEPGEIATPYRSALGYHLFRLESKDTLQGEGLMRTRQQIREILFRQKFEARLEAWLKEIKQRAIIEVRM
ncbi:MAG: peptidylprolyl isomerase [Candidatus Rokubacteria bacterium]|nr:peptidylprolyl isomerase [Candidatus Rokubacteria bacterium]